MLLAMWPGDDWFASCEETAWRLERVGKAYSRTICFACGATACFYSQHFTYSVLFWQAFSMVGWSATRRSFCEIWRRSRAAVAAARSELPEELPSLEDASSKAQEVVVRLQTARIAFQRVQEGDEKAAEELSEEIQALQAMQQEFVCVQQVGAAAMAASSEMQIQRLMELTRALRSSFTASLKAAMSGGTDMLGFGVNVGDTIASFVSRASAPLLKNLMDRAMSSMGEELQELCADSNAGKWVQDSILMLSRSLGIAASIYVDGILFPILNARVGAELMSHEIIAWLVARNLLSQTSGSLVATTLLMEYSLCIGGLYYQFVSGTQCGLAGICQRLFWQRPSMPGVLCYALSGPLYMERLIVAAVTGKRAGLLG